MKPPKRGRSRPPRASYTPDIQVIVDAFLQTTREAVVLLDDKCRIIAASPAFRRRFSLPDHDLRSECLFDIGDGQFDMPDIHALLESTLTAQRAIADFKVQAAYGNSDAAGMCINARRLEMSRAASTMVLLTIEALPPAMSPVAHTPPVPERLPPGAHADARADRQLKRQLVLRRQAAREARRAQTELARVGRIAALGELTATLAHELNQPLCAIVTNAQAARRQGWSENLNLEELQDTLEDIVRDGKRAARIIQDLRDFLQRGVSDRTVLDVNHAIREIVDFAEADAELHHAVIRTGFDDSLPPVLGNRVQIQQVVWNLIRNGLEAVNANHREPREVLVSTTPHPEGMVEIVVRDNGVGLSEEARHHMFEMFFTTKQNGLGVGLSISKSLIRAHGGQIWATSNADRGASFHVTLPVATKIGAA